MAHLKIQIAENVFQSREIIGAISIGRGEEGTNDLIVDDVRCSRSHARIYLDGKDIIIEDENSSYGTFVNQQRISKRILQNNDSITIASQKIWYLEKDIAPCSFNVDYRDVDILRSDWSKVLKATDVTFIIPTIIGKMKHASNVIAQKIHLLSTIGMLPKSFFNCIAYSLSNAAKHGNKGHSELCVFIRLSIIENKLIVEVRDQGNGFEYIKALAKIKKSAGLNLIRTGCDLLEWNLVGNQLKLWKNFTVQTNKLSKADFEKSLHNIHKF